MKKIFVLVLVAIMATACGCASALAHKEQSQPPVENINQVESAAPEESQNVVLNKDVKINDENSIVFGILERDSVETGTAGCTFDGKDVNLEFQYVLAIMNAYKSMDIKDYDIVVMTGEDSGIYSVRDDAFSLMSTPPASYKDVTLDNASVYRDQINGLYKKLGLDIVFTEPASKV
jgi:hypothetical protein